MQAAVHEGVPRTVAGRLLCRRNIVTQQACKVCAVLAGPGSARREGQVRLPRRNERRIVVAAVQHQALGIRHQHEHLHLREVGQLGRPRLAHQERVCALPCPLDQGTQPIDGLKVPSNAQCAHQNAHNGCIARLLYQVVAPLQLSAQLGGHAMLPLQGGGVYNRPARLRMGQLQQMQPRRRGVAHPHGSRVLQGGSSRKLPRQSRGPHCVAPATAAADTTGAATPGRPPSTTASVVSF
mmetsp:Transcript_4875/g.14021  ORF Transcript_4875/g.14021 Transcript_4875/m.14021 type:complete len:238 (-) Transcript_4875:501-1214(-)